MTARPPTGMGDFMWWYCSWYTATHGGGTYRPEEMHECLRTFFDVPNKHATMPYPPTLIPILSPIELLGSPIEADIAWRYLLLLLYAGVAIGGVLLARRLWPGRIAISDGIVASLVGLTNCFVLWDILWCQVNVLASIGVLLFSFFIVNRSLVGGGGALALMLIKPHVGTVISLAALSALRWKLGYSLRALATILVAAGTVTTVLLVVAVTIAGPGIVGDYLALLTDIFAFHLQPGLLQEQLVVSSKGVMSWWLIEKILTIFVALTVLAIGFRRLSLVPWLLMVAAVAPMLSVYGWAHYYASVMPALILTFLWSPPWWRWMLILLHTVLIMIFYAEPDLTQQLVIPFTLGLSVLMVRFIPSVDPDREAV